MCTVTVIPSDARQNIDAILNAAKSVFMTMGVDAPVREIAEEAGVGIGTLYRHFPQRSELIAAVFRREIDSCAEAAEILSSAHPPFKALLCWMQRYVDFITAKRGLAIALHSGEPAFEALPGYFEQRLKPALKKLLDAAEEAGEINSFHEPYELLRAVASLCTPAKDVDDNHAKRMVSLLLNGLRK